MAYWLKTRETRSCFYATSFPQTENQTSLLTQRNQAQEGCSERPIGHLISAAPNRIKTCTGKFVAMAYKR